MATVWAPFRAERVGRWADQAYETGWSHTIHFSSLRDLLNGMGSRGGLRGQVTRLGVVAHGDRQGLIQLDRHVTTATLGSFSHELQDPMLEMLCPRWLHRVQGA